MEHKFINGVKVERTLADIDRRLSQMPTPEEELQAKREAMIVTPFQFKKALTRSGEKRGQVNNLVSNPNTGDPIIDQDIKDGWESANTIERLNDLALYVQATLGWTDEEADAIFELAQTL